MGKKALFLLVILSFSFLCLSPVFSIITKGLQGGLSILRSREEWQLLGNSLFLGLVVSFLATLMGSFTGIVLFKCDIPFKVPLVLSLFVPIFLPPYIPAISWMDIIGANWIDNQWAGFLGSVLCLLNIYFPIPFGISMLFLASVNPRYEEAARLIYPQREVIKRITIPLVMPGFLLSFFLVFVLSVGNFNVPSLFRLKVYPVESFTVFSAFYDFERAIALSIPLVIIILMLFIPLSLFLLKKSCISLSLGFKNVSKGLDLGRFKWPIFAFLLLLSFVFCILPIGNIVFDSLSLDAYRLAISRGGDAIMRSLFYSFSSASIIAFFGFLIAYAKGFKIFPHLSVIDALFLFLFSLPGNCLALGFIDLWNREYTGMVYGSFMIIVLGFISRYAIFSSTIIYLWLSLIPKVLDEAARVFGVRVIKRILFIQVPLSKMGILASWMISFIFCFRDTDLVMPLYPPGLEPVTVRTFTLMANGRSDMIAALCTMTMVVPLLFLVLIYQVLRVKRS